MTDIISNLNTVKQRIEKSCRKSGRSPKEIKLLLATKTVPVEQIRIAINSGGTLIGEN